MNCRQCEAPSEQNLCYHCRHGRPACAFCDHPHRGGHLIGCEDARRRFAELFKHGACFCGQPEACICEMAGEIQRLQDDVRAMMQDELEQLDQWYGAGVRRHAARAVKRAVVLTVAGMRRTTR